MRILDKNWPWQLLAAFLFIGAMAALRYMMVGFNEDFGWGFGVGALTGLFIALAGVGWRRGEMTRAVDVQSPEQNH